MEGMALGAISLNILGGKTAPNWDKELLNLSETATWSLMFTCITKRNQHFKALKVFWNVCGSHISQEKSTLKGGPPMGNDIKETAKKMTSTESAYFKLYVLNVTVECNTLSSKLRSQ